MGSEDQRHRELMREALENMALTAGPHSVRTWEAKAVCYAILQLADSVDRAGELISRTGCGSEVKEPITQGQRKKEAKGE